MATATFTPDGSEIRLRDAKPAFEWILGCAIRKMRSRRRHAVLQAALAGILIDWAGDRGIVGTEWHCRLAPGAKSGGRSFPISATSRANAPRR